VTFGTKKLEWRGIAGGEKIENMFIHFDRMYEPDTDRRTDRQTDTA